MARSVCFENFAPVWSAWKVGIEARGHMTSYRHAGTTFAKDIIWRHNGSEWVKKKATGTEQNCWTVILQTWINHIQLNCSKCWTIMHEDKETKNKKKEKEENCTYTLSTFNIIKIYSSQSVWHIYRQFTLTVTQITQSLYTFPREIVALTFTICCFRLHSPSVMSAFLTHTRMSWKCQSLPL